MNEQPRIHRYINYKVPGDDTLHGLHIAYQKIDMADRVWEIEKEKRNAEVVSYGWIHGMRYDYIDARKFRD